MPGYDDINGGLPPGAVDPYALPYPPPHWLPDGTPDDSVPPDAFAPPAGPQLGPMPDGSSGPALGPPPVTDAPLGPDLGAPQGPPPGGPPDTGPPLPYGALAPPPPPPSPFGPPAPSAVAQLPDFTVSNELPPPPPPLAYGVNPGDASAQLPSGRETTFSDPFAGMSDTEAYQAAEKLSPAQMDQLARSQEVARKTRAVLDQTRADAEDLQRLKNDQEAQAKANAITQAKSDQIVADALALSKRPLDRGRWFSNLSTAQKVFAAIATIGSGLMSKPGGPNLGLDFVTKHIDDDIADQKADIENERAGIQARQGAVAQEFARTGDLYRAAETVRLATYKAVINKMQTEQQNFDPRGTAFIEHGKAIQQMQSAFGAKLDAANKDEFERSLKAIKADQEERALRETMRKNRAEEALAAQKEAREAAAQRSKKEESPVLTPLQIHQQFPSLPVEAIPPAGASAADLGKHIDTYNKSLESADKTLSNTVNQAATVVRNPITKEPLRDETGQTLRMKAEDASKFSEEIGKSQQFIDTLADIRRDLDADPSSLDRKKWASITTRYERAKTKFIGTVGAKPSSREMQAVEEMFGTNFEDFQDRVVGKGKAMARIDALIDGTQQDISTDVGQRLGYKAPTGPDGRPVPLLRDTSRPAKHVETSDEGAARRVLENPMGDNWSGQPVDRELEIEPDDYRRVSPAQASTLVVQRLRDAGGLVPSQRATIESWAADAAGPDPRKAREAISNLANAANQAELPAVRALASQKLLDNVAATGSPESPPVQQPERQTAHETIPLYPAEPLPVVNPPRRKR